MLKLFELQTGVAEKWILIFAVTGDGRGYVGGAEGGDRGCDEPCDHGCSLPLPFLPLIHPPLQIKHGSFSTKSRHRPDPI